MNRRRLITILGVGSLWIISLFLVIWLLKPTITMAPSPAPSPAPVKQLVKPKKAVIVKSEPTLPAPAQRPVINNYNIQSSPRSEPATINNYNIQQTEPAAPPTPAPTPPTIPPPPATKVPTSYTMVPQPAASAVELVIYNKSFESSQFQQVDSATTPVQMKMVVCNKYQGCSWRWVTIYPPSLAKAAGASFLAVCDDNYGCYKRWVTIFSP